MRLKPLALLNQFNLRRLSRQIPFLVEDGTATTPVGTTKRMTQTQPRMIPIGADHVGMRHHPIDELPDLLMMLRILRVLLPELQRIQITKHQNPLKPRHQDLKLLLRSLRALRPPMKLLNFLNASTSQEEENLRRKTIRLLTYLKIFSAVLES